MIFRIQSLQTEEAEAVEAVKRRYQAIKKAYEEKKLLLGK